MGFPAGESDSDGRRRKISIDVIGGKEAYLVMAFSFLLFFLEKLLQIWGKEGSGEVVAQSADTAVAFVCPPAT